MVDCHAGHLAAMGVFTLAGVVSGKPAKVSRWSSPVSKSSTAQLHNVTGRSERHDFVCGGVHRSLSAVRKCYPANSTIGFLVSRTLPLKRNHLLVGWWCVPGSRPADKRRAIQKLLSELPPKEREKVENVFRAEVNDLRLQGHLVGEETEINIYIKALGQVGKTCSPKQSDRKDDRPITGSDRSKDDARDRSQKSDEKTVKEPRTRRAGSERPRTSCKGKISLEGLTLTERRVTVQKALSQVPDFIVRKIKARQKASLAKITKPGESRELDAMTEAFNFMFNEDGNVLALALRDLVFSPRKLCIKTDLTVKQLDLPQFDGEVRKFKGMDAVQQIAEMKKRREPLSVLLKLLQMKKQNDVFDKAEQAKLTLSEAEKNIIRFQVLLDITDAVSKRKKERNSPAGESEAELDEGDCATKTGAATQPAKRKSDTTTPSVKRAKKVVVTEVIEISDSDDESEPMADEQATEREKIQESSEDPPPAGEEHETANDAELSQMEADDEIEKLLGGMSSDEEQEVVIDGDF